MSALEEPSAEEPKRHVGPREAFRVAAHRNFGPYFLGNALSASGTWFQNLAASILVYRLTHSPFLLGVLTFSQFAPVLLLAPWAGRAGDRYDRKHLLLVTQGAALVLSATLAILAFAHLATAAVVIAFSLGLGIVMAFFAGPQQAIVPSLVPDRDLGSAIALNSMTFNIARATGPALAALAIAAFGIPIAFMINAASYLLFIGGLLLVEPRPHARPTQARFRESLELLRAEPRLLWLLFVVAAVGFASDPINTEAPAFAREFGHPDTWSGLIIGLYGAGAVAAALFVAGREGSPRRTVAMLLVLVSGMTLFCLSPNLGIGFVFLFIAGFGYLTANARVTTQLQLGVHESQRGRIAVLWSIAFIGLRPLASLTDGAIAGLFGVRVAGIALQIPALAAAVLVARRRRRARVAATASEQAAR